MKRWMSILTAMMLTITMIVSTAGVVEGAETFTENNYMYKVRNGEATITRYIGEESVVTTPAMLGGYPVTAIGNQAFHRNVIIEDVTISRGVTVIGNEAFRKCEALMYVEFPDTLTLIGDYAFSGCLALSNVEIPDSVTAVGECAFSGTGIVTIEFPDSITEMGVGVVGASMLLESIKFPRNLTEISAYMMEFCGSLSNIEMGDRITKIGKYSICTTNIQSIHLPYSLKEIEKYAFNSCGRLTDVYYDGTQEDWNAIIIAEGNTGLEQATIHFAPPIAQGDANADGTVNMMDVSATYGVVSGNGALTTRQMIAVDINGDGTVTMMDVLALYQQVSGNQ